MKKILTSFLVLLLAISLVGCAGKKTVDLNSETAKQVQEQFDEYLFAQMKENLSVSKISAHFVIQDLSVYGLEDMDVSLGDPKEDVDYSKIKEALEQINKIDVNYLTDNQKNYYIRYKRLLEWQLDDEKLTDYQFIFSPNNGINNNLLTTITEFDIRNEQDIKDIIVYLGETKDYMNGCLELTQEQMDKGISQTADTMKQIVEQCERFLSKKGKNNEASVAINARIDQLEGLDKNKKEAYKKEVIAAVSNSMEPAYQAIIDFFKEKAENNTTVGGYSQWEDGKKYYANLVRYKISNDMSIDNLLKELENHIDDGISELQSIITKDPDVLDRFGNGKYKYTKAQDILKYLESECTKIVPEIDPVNYEVSYLDPSITADSIAAYYLIPTLDDFKDNVIRVNPKTSAVLFTTLAHEGFPGHLYQNMYFLQHNYNPINYYIDFIGYTEGWAVYMESLVGNWGGLDDELLAEVTSINDTLTQYLVAYIDIQVNYNGWSLDDTTSYCNSWGLDGEFVYNYVVGDPGLYLPYAVGYMQMSDLNKMAQEKLGDKFDIKEFNQVILECGAAPFDYVTEKVNEYIKSK